MKRGLTDAAHNVVEAPAPPARTGKASIVGIALRRWQKNQLREQITALRAELDELRSAERPPIESEGEDPSSAEAFRRRVLKAEIASRSGHLEALLSEAAELRLRVEEVPRPSPVGTAWPRPLRLFKSIASRGRAATAFILVGASALLLLVGTPRAFDRTASPAMGSEQPRSNPAVELAPVISGWTDEKGTRFFAQEIRYDYADGRVILSGEPSLDREFLVDDSIAIAVARPDGTTARWSYTFNTDCYANFPVPAKDLTELFAPGTNVITVELFDVCGATYGISEALLLRSIPG